VRCARGWRSSAASLAAAVAVAATATTAAAVLVPVGPAAAVPPTSPDCKPPANHRQITDAPWHLRRYAPQRIWPLTTGSGVTVAVIDSGVDGTHPQLSGRVAPGRDFLDKQPAATFDCVGHGTGVASIIAAGAVDGVGFAGLAPGVQILPIRVSEKQLVDSSQGQGASVSFADLAKAITQAVDLGAKVINLSLYYFTDDQAVRDAVADAVRRDVVVVAAVGNLHNQDSDEPDGTPYPAAYDGVLGVGSIDESGARAADSQVGPFVDLVAPGVDITVAANRTKDHWITQGTSFAAPHVAAAAALIRSRWPSLRAADVARQLIATASPVKGGPYSQQYGFGEVDPYRAVNETPANGVPRQPAPLPLPEREAAETAAAAHARTLLVAGWLAALVLLVTAGALFVGWVLPKGRRRGWRPGVTRPAGAADVEDTAAGVFSWSLGPPPALAHPDRATEEELVRQVRQRRR
jgi:membrane-anchored mycosin MYCP